LDEQQELEVSIYKAVSRDIWDLLPGEPVEKLQTILSNLERFLEDNKHIDRTNTTISIYTEHGVELVYHMTNDTGMRTKDVHIMFDLDGQIAVAEKLIPSLVLAKARDTLMVERSRS
jgi:hypothetical protein